MPMAYFYSYRIGKQEDSNNSAWWGSDSAPRHDKDKEAEQARQFAEQVSHEERVPPHGQGC